MNQDENLKKSDNVAELAGQPYGECLDYIQLHQAGKRLPPVRTMAGFFDTLARCGFFVDGPYETNPQSPVRQQYGTLMGGVICYTSLPPRIIKAVQTAEG